MSVVDIKVDAKLDLWLKNLKTSWQASVAAAGATYHYINIA